MKKSHILFAMAILFTELASGQNRNIVVGAGYTAPTAVVRAAPGEVVTVFTRGILTRVADPVVASTLPLPTILRGISVLLRQAAAPPEVAVPLFSIHQFDSCQGIAPEPCVTTAITLQIPFELVPETPGAVPATGNSARLVVVESGVPGEPLALVAQTDQIHAVTNCDTTSAGAAPSPLPCPTPIVTYADGGLVTAARPARPGETLVMYAFGLGRTTPLLPSGQPSPTTPAVTAGLLDFNFSVNAPPRLRRDGPSVQRALFAGLTPGFVGLYQVNFLVPEIPPSVLPCSATNVSNVTVTLIGATSFDGAGICVQP